MRLAAALTALVSLLSVEAFADGGNQPANLVCTAGSPANLQTTGATCAVCICGYYDSVTTNGTGLVADFKSIAVWGTTACPATINLRPPGSTYNMVCSQMYTGQMHVIPNVSDRMQSPQ
jgi:hypothetical protein